MKRYGIVLIATLCLLFTGCGNQEEKVAYECSLWGGLEYYDTSNVTEIYSKDNKNISKLHITTSYSARWDDVDTTDLVERLNTEKDSMYHLYEQVSYEIHQFGNNITTEQYLTLTENNLKQLSQDEQYQQMMKKNQLPIETYVNWMTNQNYQCQNKNS